VYVNIYVYMTLTRQSKWSTTLFLQWWQHWFRLWSGRGTGVGNKLVNRQTYKDMDKLNKVENCMNKDW